VLTPSGMSPAEGAETGESRRPVGAVGGDTIDDSAVVLSCVGRVPSFGDATGPCYVRATAILACFAHAASGCARARVVAPFSLTFLGEDKARSKKQ
jgi:hypothetical protein